MVYNNYLLINLCLVLNVIWKEIRLNCMTVILQVKEVKTYWLRLFRLQVPVAILIELWICRPTLNVISWYYCDDIVVKLKMPLSSANDLSIKRRKQTSVCFMYTLNPVSARTSWASLTFVNRNKELCHLANKITVWKNSAIVTLAHNIFKIYFIYSKYIYPVM